MGERGLVIAFFMFIVLLVVLPLFWIMFNELITPFFGTGFLAGVLTESTGFTGAILWTLWRVTPVIWLVSGIIYLIRESHSQSRL